MASTLGLSPLTWKWVKCPVLRQIRLKYVYKQTIKDFPQTEIELDPSRPRALKFWSGFQKIFQTVAQVWNF